MMANPQDGVDTAVSIFQPTAEMLLANTVGEMYHAMYGDGRPSFYVDDTGVFNCNKMDNAREYFSKLHTTNNNCNARLRRIPANPSWLEWYDLCLK